jgi:radical SAM superfamily enzyme YgiQ (UPF0313 family)/inorganic pyrophosphatase
MRILFLEAYKESPISVKIALPFAYLTLASYVTSRSDNYKFFFHSYQLDHLCSDSAVSITDLMYRCNPDVIMVGAYTSNFYRSVDLLNQAKKFGVITIIGGIFAHDNAELILATYPCVDIVVTGEGEITLLQILNALYYEKSLHEVKGIVFRLGDMIVRTQEQDRRVKAWDLPLLDLSLLPIDKYRQVLQRHYVFASRGCQYHCDFCTVNAVWNWRVTLRRMEHVQHDLSLLVKTFGAKATSLVDSNITTYKHYYPRLLSQLRESVPQVKLAVKGRVDELSKEYLYQLKLSGANHLALGIETPFSSQLRILSKTQSPDSWAPDVFPLLEYACEIGFPINFSFILGTPDEDERTLQFKVDYAIRLYERYKARPFLNFMTPHPGTPSAQTLKQDGLRIVDANWEHYDHLHPVVIPSSQPDSFVDLLLSAYNEISFNTDTEQINPASLPELESSAYRRFPIHVYSLDWRLKTSTRQIWAAIEDVIGSTTHHEFDLLAQKFEVKSTFSRPWPFHYGFLPGIYSGDEEELDIAIFSSLPAETGQLRRVRIIGMVLMKDGDTKVFGVFPEDQCFSNITEYGDLSDNLRSLTSSIFEREGPRFEKFIDSRYAYQHILSLYQNNA